MHAVWPGIVLVGAVGEPTVISGRDMSVCAQGCVPITDRRQGDAPDQRTDDRDQQNPRRAAGNVAPISPVCPCSPNTHSNWTLTTTAKRGLRGPSDHRCDQAGRRPTTGSPERELADRADGADRQSFAEVAQPDPDGEEQRQPREVRAAPAILNCV